MYMVHTYGSNCGPCFAALYGPWLVPTVPTKCWAVYFVGMRVPGAGSRSGETLGQARRGTQAWIYASLESLVDLAVSLRVVWPIGRAVKYGQNLGREGKRSLWASWRPMPWSCCQGKIKPQWVKTGKLNNNSPNGIARYPILPDWRGIQ
jgi:hypothetical protein